MSEEHRADGEDREDCQLPGRLWPERRGSHEGDGHESHEADAVDKCDVGPEIESAPKAPSGDVVNGDRDAAKQCEAIAQQRMIPRAGRSCRAAEVTPADDTCSSDGQRDSEPLYRRGHFLQPDGRQQRDDDRLCVDEDDRRSDARVEDRRVPGPEMECEEHTCSGSDQAIEAGKCRPLPPSARPCEERRDEEQGESEPPNRNREWRIVRYAYYGRRDSNPEECDCEHQDRRARLRR